MVFRRRGIEVGFQSEGRSVLRWVALTCAMAGTRLANVANAANLKEAPRETA